MFALRGPLSIVGGAFCSFALFLVLSQLVTVPFEVGEASRGLLIEFTPQIKDTPVENKRDPKVARIPPTVVPEPGGVRVRTPGTAVNRVVYVEPIVEVAPGHGLPVGTDRDVLPLVRIPPDYPPRAALANIEGWVQVRFSITPAGSVRDAVVVASEPGTMFDEAALEAIARWRYNPRVANGVAVERVGLETVIRFELAN